MLLLSITKSMCLHGLEGIVIDVEVDISNGIPCWEIVGLPDGYTIGFNSWVMTASGDIALRKSDGTWNWIE